MIEKNVGSFHHQNHLAVCGAFQIGQIMFNVLQFAQFAGPAPIRQLTGRVGRDAVDIGEQGNLLNRRFGIARGTNIIPQGREHGPKSIDPILPWQRRKANNPDHLHWATSKFGHSPRPRQCSCNCGSLHGKRVFAGLKPREMLRFSPSIAPLLAPAQPRLRHRGNIAAVRGGNGIAAGNDF